MRKLHLPMGIAALTVAALLTSCSKKDDQAAPQKPTIVSTTAVNIDADVANKGSFTLYSLADNKVVPNSDSATSKWDIGFRATTIIVNGGVSGPGNATAQVMSGVYNDLTVAPETGYIADAAATKAIGAWYTYNMDTHIISPTAGKFIVLKTAAGKYAKLEVTSYYKDAPVPPVATSVSRYYHFRYVLQADGTRNFK
ncbi:heme-binding HmuY-like protein [Chitinophaga dinghuensis]|uniref:Heme-binding HmuY-like protein n=1 Tax=Chitinophaga dinghuensis TaxID=1539050 RepID=A0A327VZF7_9BACT|nr:HmuY family protein [Chitinophaga dinghuensis]RAJ80305.1 heme-binding HmuY-like protein [Chitinophaga dinghuensis]